VLARSWLPDQVPVSAAQPATAPSCSAGRRIEAGAVTRIAPATRAGSACAGRSSFRAGLRHVLRRADAGIRGGGTADLVRRRGRIVGAAADVFVVVPVTEYIVALGHDRAQPVAAPPGRWW